MGRGQLGRSFAIVVLVGIGAACTISAGRSTGACASNGDCVSDNCFQGQCICESDSDCSAGQTCAMAGCMPGILCGGARTCFVPYTGDAGCYANYIQFGTASCPAGTQCNQATGGCDLIELTYPTCGSFDESGGYDAGFGPGPTAGGTCADCLGCPRGAECVCGLSGQLGAVSCGPGNENLGAATACFFTGELGSCQIFPGDCATNSQCTGTAATPYCSSIGSCVQCLRDDQCPQDGGAEGCFDGTCGRCCTADAQCPSSAPACIQGFCYAQCEANADCGAADAGTPFCCGAVCQAKPCDAGVTDAG